MDWIKLLTDLEGHPKVLAVGNAGTGVYVRSLAYCGKYETDGLVPKAWAEQAIAREGHHQILGQLVDAGLWEECSEGYEIRDFTEVNRSHEEMQALRETRSAAGKTGGKAKGKAKRKQKPNKSHSNSVSSSSSSAVEEGEWQDWLSHYQLTTGRKSVSGSAEAQGLFNARRSEGVSLDDLKAATVGCHGDAYLRERKLDRPETILRPSKFRRYIELARDKPLHAVPPAPIPENLSDGLPELEAVWPKVSDRLRASLGPSTFAQWLEPLRPAGKVGAEVYLSAPENVLAWVQRRYTALIAKAFAAEGMPDVAVLLVPPAEGAEAVAA